MAYSPNKRFKPPCSGGDPDFNADILGGGKAPGPYLKGVGRPLNLVG